MPSAMLAPSRRLGTVTRFGPGIVFLAHLHLGLEDSLASLKALVPSTTEAY